MTPTEYLSIKEQIKGSIALLNLSFSSINFSKLEKRYCILKQTNIIILGAVRNTADRLCDFEHQYSSVHFRGFNVSPAVIESIEIVDGTVDVGKLLFGTTIKKLDLSRFTTNFLPVIHTPVFNVNNQLGIGIYDIFRVSANGGPALGDCGELRFVGQNRYRYNSIDEIQSYLILKLLSDFQTNLSSKSFIICTGANDIKEFLSSSVKESYLNNGTLPSLCQIINYMAYYSNGLHPITHRGYERKDTVSEQGHKLWNGEAITKRNHWFHYITLDGIHKFYKSEDFQSLNLLSS